MADAVEGIDTRRVTKWMTVRAEVTPPLHFTPIAGGRSNLTYRVEDAGGRRWVLRRPPLHSVLASAHDVGRECRVIAALQDTAVPVPPVVDNEISEEVTGAPFYVMEFVDGLVPRDTKTVTSTLNAVARRAMASNMAETLADLHSIDIDEVGLGGLAKRSDYIPRQLRRWSVQYQKGSERNLPLVMAVHDRLAADVPEQGRPAIVHGDYRLDNLILGDDGCIRAVLDWELCTLGDPLADLGLLAVYWLPPGGREMPMIPPAGAIPGVPPIEDVIARYGQRAGRDLSQLDYYVAFGYWKLAVILEGVYTRYASGAYGQTDGSHETFGYLVTDLLELAADAAGRAGR